MCGSWITAKTSRPSRSRPTLEPKTASALWPPDSTFTSLNLSSPMNCWPSWRVSQRGSRIEDRGSRIEDRGLKIEDRVFSRKAIFDPRSSILDPLIARIRVDADHPNKGRRDDGCQPPEPAPVFSEQRHVLMSPGTDRQDEPSAHGQLLRERIGDPRRCGGADDRLEGGVRWRALSAITDEHERIRDSCPAKVLTGGDSQIRETLDRYDKVAKPREDRSLESKPGADFQRAVRRLEIESLYHPRDQRRLSGNLRVGDGQGAVLVSVAGELRRNEVGPSHGAEGVEHASVANSLRPNLSDEIVVFISARHTT